MAWQEQHALKRPAARRHALLQHDLDAVELAVVRDAHAQPRDVAPGEPLRVGAEETAAASNGDAQCFRV